MFTIEGATPNESRQLNAWLDAIAEELFLKNAGYKIHVRLVDEIDVEGAGAFMFPIPTPDRQFYIELSRSSNRMLPALCHECVHVEQCMRGDNVIENMPAGRAYWKGRKYHLQSVIKRASRDRKFYENLPWEKEAHERMWPLARRVLARCQ